MNPLTKNPPKPDLMDALGYAGGSLECSVIIAHLMYKVMADTQKQCQKEK